MAESNNGTRADGRDGRDGRDSSVRRGQDHLLAYTNQVVLEYRLRPSMKGILYELPEPEDVFCGARPYREDPPLQAVADARGPHTLFCLTIDSKSISITVATPLPRKVSRCRIHLPTYLVLDCGKNQSDLQSSSERE